MAKDAHGHGSNSRGGGNARNTLAAGNFAANARRLRDDAFLAKTPNNSREAAAGVLGRAGAPGEPSNTQAAASLAQGHPKSAAVDTHPSMVDKITEYGLTQRLSRPVKVF